MIKSNYGREIAIILNYINEKVDLEMIIGWGGVGGCCNPTLNLVLKQT